MSTLENNNNVIGPIDADTWYTLRELRSSIRAYGDDPKFKIAKDKEKLLFDYIMKTDVRKAA